MTDDEMAEEYADKNKVYIDFDNDISDYGNVKKAFLAGLKAGREIEREYVKNNAFTSMKEQGLFPFGKWHDLKKDPSDLPEPYTTVLDEDGIEVPPAKARGF